MTLTARDIAEITRLLEDSSFDELEIEIDGLKVHLKRGGATQPKAANGSASSGASPRPSRVEAARVEPLRAEQTVPLHDENLVGVQAPLLGTFYRAPKPGAAAFVEVGSTVEADSIIGIIEVMKLMNTVRAGVRGVVRQIRARDGVLVEYGETLLLVDPREPG